MTGRIAPERTLAVILGAHEWPNTDLEGSISFFYSAAAIRNYLVEARGFGLPESQLLDLFGSAAAPSDLILEIGNFLKGQGEGNFENVILYYVGHGWLDANHNYYLALSKTTSGFEEDTSLSMRSLGICLKRNAGFLRRFLILDCCFSGEALPLLMSAERQVVAKKTLASFPKRGTMLFCSSNRNHPSVAPRDRRFTMFSGALYQTLIEGDARLPRELNFEEVSHLTWDRLQKEYGDGAVRPELHVPDQREGDVSRLPVFPNPRKAAVEAATSLKGKRYPKYGSLSLSSAEGGRLFLDGEQVDRLNPFETYLLEKFPAGRHHIRIEANGFETISERILLRPEEAVEKHYEPDELKKQARPFPGETKQPTVEEAKPKKHSRVEAPKPGTRRSFSMGNDHACPMVWIPPGSFTMGSPVDEVVRSVDEVQHEVEITRGFWLGETPVTQAQWQAVMGTNPSHFKSENRPVESVSWEDIQKFLEKLNEKEKGKPFRLPSEAEWEYACRAGTEGRYAGKLEEMAWYIKNAKGATHEVGQKKANAWGLYDMHGNVWEWCGDWHGPYPEKRMADPLGPDSGSDRVVRGGSWDGSAGDCRSAFRVGRWPGRRGRNLGFRLLRTTP